MSHAWQLVIIGLLATALCGWVPIHGVRTGRMPAKLAGKPDYSPTNDPFSFWLTLVSSVLFTIVGVAATISGIWQLIDGLKQ